VPFIEGTLTIRHTLACRTPNGAVEDHRRVLQSQGSTEIDPSKGNCLVIRRQESEPQTQVKHHSLARIAAMASWRALKRNESRRIL
jgi:hypothetical protein